MLIHVEKITPVLSLLEAKEDQLPQPLLVCQMLQFVDHLCGCLVDLLQFVHVFLVLGSPKVDTILKMWLHQWLVEGGITFLDLLAVLSLMQPRMLLAKGLKNALIPHVQLVVHQVSRFFSAVLLSKQSASSLLD